MDDVLLTSSVLKVTIVCGLHSVNTPCIAVRSSGTKKACIFKDDSLVLIIYTLSYKGNTCKALITNKEFREESFEFCYLYYI